VSFRTLVVGPEVSGTSTVAGQLALLIHKLAGREGKPLAVCTAPTLVYRKMPVRVKAARSAREFVETLQSASGTVIGDQFSDIYGDLVGSYTEASRRARTERGLPDHWGVLGPHDFRLIRNRLDGIYRTVRGLDLDLIEIYRLGSGEDGEMKVRGASGTGRGADLILLLEGGLGSLRMDRRRIRVFSDASLLASKEVRDLPRIDTPKDLKELAELLSGMLTPSIRALLAVAQEEAELWATVPDAGEMWPEVEGLAQRAEVEQFVAEIRTLCEINEISGRDRTTLLYEMFRVGDFESLLSVPVLTLRMNRERFQIAASQLARQRTEAEAIRTRVRQELDKRLLGGTSNEAKAGRADRLSRAFGTDLDGLEKLSLPQLKEGLVAFLAAFAPFQPRDGAAS
jgi:hypothetical protein